jgi:hypothetical protein
MPTITYQELCSSFYMKGEQYELFTSDVTDDMRNEFLCSLIHSAVADPYVNRLFKNGFSVIDPDYERDDNGEIILDENEEPIEADGRIEYELEYEVNELADKVFVMDVIGFGMLYAWALPLVYSSVNFRQFYGTSGEKFYAQQTHITVTQDMLEKIQYQQRRLIRDRGYSRNIYLDGDSASSRLRSSVSS